MELTNRDIERFWARVDRSGGEQACWPWLGARDPSGYGAFKLNGKKVNTNRVSFLVANGRLPAPGLDAAHAPVVCHERACCNPSHIREATRAENARDMVLDGTLNTLGLRLGAGAAFRYRTHCLHGHPFADENVYHRLDGGRRCRECARAANRAYAARLRESISA